MISGNTVRLRAWNESDLPVLTELRNDVKLQAQLLARARGSTESDVRGWLNRRSSNESELFFIIADHATDIALGFVQIVGIDPIDRCGEFGICLTQPSQGNGRGLETVLLLLQHLHTVRRLHKLILRVRSDNERAIRCYEKAGFCRCGLLREHVLFEEHWHDVILMERPLEDRAPICV